MLHDKTAPIHISRPKYSQEAVSEIVGSIRMDILRWADVHGEYPASILVTPELHLALRDSTRGIANYAVDADRQEWLFGIMISRYYPVGGNADHAMAYHLTGKERRFVFNQEGV